MGVSLTNKYRSFVSKEVMGLPEEQYIGLSLKKQNTPFSRRKMGRPPKMDLSSIRTNGV